MSLGPKLQIPSSTFCSLSKADREVVGSIVGSQEHRSSQWAKTQPASQFPSRINQNTSCLLPHAGFTTLVSCTVDLDCLCKLIVLPRTP